MRRDNAPIRILHVVGGMGRGGAEMWLMHMLRRMDRSRFQMDFLVHTESPCAFDDEIRGLGSQVYPCMHPHQPLRYAHNFRRIVSEYGPYDIIHSAVHHFSGYVLRLASQCGIPGRLAHSHNTSAGMERSSSLPRRFYFKLMEEWIQQYATGGLACSTPAAAALFGENWPLDPRWHIHYPSTDLTPFRQPSDPTARSEFGIPNDVFVVGHVGRFDFQKNHTFLLQIIDEALGRDKTAHALLVGDGPLRPQIETQASQCAGASRIHFAGPRSDVPRLMRSVMNVFTLPSLHEGLPLVVVEAQAAGLPVVLSDVITNEAGVIESLSQRLSLSQSAGEWAAELLDWRHRERPRQPEALRLIESSPFHIENAKLELERIYLINAGLRTTARTRKSTRCLAES
jgi:glycosyltransferase involved in cell wall biosynthesis